MLIKEWEEGEGGGVTCKHLFLIIIEAYVFLETDVDAFIAFIEIATIMLLFIQRVITN